jgi:hypothetical protein
VSIEGPSRENDLLRAAFGEQPWYAVRCVFLVHDDHLPAGQNA